MENYEMYGKLHDDGNSIEEIAEHCCVPEYQVKQGIEKYEKRAEKDFLDKIKKKMIENGVTNATATRVCNFIKSKKCKNLNDAKMLFDAMEVKGGHSGISKYLVFKDKYKEKYGVVNVGFGMKAYEALDIVVNH